MSGFAVMKERSMLLKERFLKDNSSSWFMQIRSSKKCEESFLFIFSKNMKSKMLPKYLNSPHVNQTLRILCDQLFKTKPEEQLISIESVLYAYKIVNKFGLIDFVLVCFNCVDFPNILLSKYPTLNNLNYTFCMKMHHSFSYKNL